MIFHTLGSLLLFILIITLSLYPLGYLLLGKNIKKLDGCEVITLSFALSIVFFVLLAVFLSFINTRFLLIFVVAGLDLLAIFKYRFALLLPWRSLSKNSILLILLLLGILVEGFITFPSGYLYNNGLLFGALKGLMVFGIFH